ncbi:MAG: hypothetical protein GY799_23760 [Desulfobulbaceae bacterium]|nr:hypothetical protein [Desulfobulbaceae bacterium]
MQIGIAAEDQFHCPGIVGVDEKCQNAKMTATIMIKVIVFCDAVKATTTDPLALTPLPMGTLWSSPLPPLSWKAAIPYKENEGRKRREKAGGDGLVYSCYADILRFYVEWPEMQP